MYTTKQSSIRRASAPVVTGVLLMALGAFTTSQARAIRTDVVGDNWTQISAPQNVQYILDPAGASGSETVYDNSSSLYQFDDSSPTLYDSGDCESGGSAGCFAEGYMYDWGSDTDPNAQVMVYDGVGDGTDQACDDEATPDCEVPGPNVPVVEIDFNNNTASGCVAGSTLSWDGITYSSDAASGTCDNAFIFVGGTLFGSVPYGWSASGGTTTPTVPEPSAVALFGLGLASLLVALGYKRRRV